MPQRQTECTPDRRRGDSPKSRRGHHFLGDSRRLQGGGAITEHGTDATGGVSLIHHPAADRIAVMRMPSTSGQIAASFGLSLIGLVLLLVTSSAGAILVVGGRSWCGGSLETETALVADRQGRGQRALSTIEKGNKELRVGASPCPKIREGCLAAAPMGPSRGRADDVEVLRIHDATSATPAELALASPAPPGLSEDLHCASAPSGEPSGLRRPRPRHCRPLFLR